MVPVAGRNRVRGYNHRVARPVAELEREDLELEVGGARLAARRLQPGIAAVAAPTLVFLHEGLGCCPTMLLQGVDDEYATAGHLAEIAARLTGPVRAELLPACGHAPHHDAPDVVTDLVARWMSSFLPFDAAARASLRGDA